MDNSKSMKKTDPEKLHNEAVKQFFNATPIGSDVGVVTYSRKVLDKGKLKEKKTAADKVESYTYDQEGKGTNIGDSLTAARDMLADSQNNPNKAIALITDGADNVGNNYNLSIDGQVIPTECRGGERRNVRSNALALGRRLYLYSFFKNCSVSESYNCTVYSKY